VNLSEQTQIILISKSKQLQLYHFPCAKLVNALPLLPWQGYSSPECWQHWRGGALDWFGEARGSHPCPGTPPVQGQLKGHIGTDPSSQGEVERWFQYTEGISKVQLCTCIRKKSGFSQKLKIFWVSYHFDSKAVWFSAFCSTKSSLPWQAWGVFHFKDEQQTI